MTPQQRRSRRSVLAVATTALAALAGCSIPGETEPGPDDSEAVDEEGGEPARGGDGEDDENGSDEDGG